MKVENTEEESASRAWLLLKRVLPLALGAGVLFYLLFFHIDFKDVEFHADIESVKVENQTFTVRTADGRSFPVSWKSVPSLKDDSGADNLNAKAEALVGSRNQPLIKPGVLSYFSELTISSVFVIAFLLLVAVAIQSVRLQLLFRCTGTVVKFGEAFKGMLVGLFYGNVIPAGQVGGDPIKALYIAKWTGSRRSAALATVFMDRLIGLACLLGLAVVALLLRGWDAEFHRYAMGILAMMGGGLIVLFVVLSPGIQRVLGIDFLLSRIPFGSKIKSITESLAGFRGHRGTLATAALLSLISQVLLVGIPYVVGSDLAIRSVAALDYLVLVPVANTVASMPGTPPGGWGVGEGAYLLLFSTLGVVAEAAFMLSAIPRLAMVALSLTGVLFLASNRSAIEAEASNATVEE